MYGACGAGDGDIDWMQFAGSEITILMPEHPVLDGMRSVMDDLKRPPASRSTRRRWLKIYTSTAWKWRCAPMKALWMLHGADGFDCLHAVVNGLIHPLTPFIEDDHMTSAAYDFADFPGGFTQATQYPPGDMDAQDYAIPFPLKPIRSSGIRTSSMSI